MAKKSITGESVNLTAAQAAAINNDKSDLRFKNGVAKAEEGPNDQALARKAVRDKFAQTSFVGSLKPVSGLVGSFLGDLADTGVSLIKSGLRLFAGAGTVAGTFISVFGGGSSPQRSNLPPAQATPGKPKEGVGETVYFQFFPENINDSRAMDVSEYKPALLSDPIPGFTAPSKREISFTLKFVREKWDQPRGDFTSGGLFVEDWDKYNFDVGLALSTLRSFTYPVNFVGGIGITPQPVWLTLPGTGIGVNNAGISDSVIGLVTRTDARMLAFFPDGQPRYAEIDVNFVEYPFMNQADNRTRGDFDRLLRDYAGRQYKVIRGSSNSSGQNNPGKTRKMRADVKVKDIF